MTINDSAKGFTKTHDGTTTILIYRRGVNRRQEGSRHRHDLKERGRSQYAKPPNKGADGHSMKS